MIDLHVHTTASDGTCSPGEVVRLASKKGMSALAITDHDTMAGVAEALEEGRTLGVEVVPGVEMSAQWERGILHILGYFVDRDHPELVKKLDYLKRGREERTPGILTKLRRLNLEISVDEVNKEAGPGVPGRPHIARIMVRKHYVSDLQEAFDRYLRKGAPAYVEKAKLPPYDALELITQAGGVPVMAHPHSLMTVYASYLEEIVRDLKTHGLQGIEAYYPKHTPENTRAFLTIARKFNLAVTGGTDFHGSNKPDVELGVIPGLDPLPYSLLEGLKERRNRRSDAEAQATGINR